MPAKGQILDLTGERFGRLTVVALYDMEKNRARWRCLCECGKEIVARSGKLRCGDKQSCGCLLPLVNGVLNRTHGEGHMLDRTPEYRSWGGLKERCCNPQNRQHANYGGRGIAVCDRWLNGDGIKGGFECFLEDMGRKPSPRHTLDRIDVDGNYAPKNCRWATPKQQSLNRRDTVYVEHQGKRVPLAEVCADIGIAVSCVKQRMCRGMPFAEAISKPSRYAP